MVKVYHLSTCNTCQRIIKELGLEDADLQDIKLENIDEKTLDKVADQHGGYEQVFSRRAMKYRSMGLNEMELSEADYKKYILEEYTFLKRPVILVDDQSFVGNTKKTIAAAKQALDDRK